MSEMLQRFSWKLPETRGLSSHPICLRRRAERGDRLMAHDCFRG
jgi:hypothetical protein